MDGEIKETRLDDVRIFRCRGPVAHVASLAIPFAVSEGANIIVDPEGRPIGWAKYTRSMCPAGGYDIIADAIIEHQSEARLLAENGELGLSLATNGVIPHMGKVVIRKPGVIQWVPSTYAYNLKPVEADWQQLFT